MAQAKESLSAAETVFLGRVLRLEPIESENDQASLAQHAWAAIEVIDPIKGVSERSIIRILLYNEGCGRKLSAGDTYFLLGFRYDSESPLTNGGCGAYLYETGLEIDPLKKEQRKSLVMEFMSLYRQAVE